MEGEAASAGELARSIVAAGAAYGRNDSEAGHTINLEFISANPTGPLHIGHTRWAALGDAMRRLLVASGADVTAEYYINDAGAQMDVFGESVLARAKGEPTPDKGYPGPYVDDLAAVVSAAAVTIAANAGQGCRLPAVTVTPAGKLPSRNP